jgi:3-hydroxyisobutyrate dehydrogenase-like beta-hydroxyacid dehydrogenase
MQIGVIGLGKMGGNMVRRLAGRATDGWCSTRMPRPLKHWLERGSRGARNSPVSLDRPVPPPLDRAAAMH